MGKKIFKIFIIGFVKACFVIACMILCGVGGYFGTRTYYTRKNERKNEQALKDIIDDAQVDKISKNLIFVWDEDKGKITNCLLEVFDTENSRMDYITIPTSGQVTIPRDVYKKLCQVNKEIPQVFKLSRICSFFDEGDDAAYGYAVLILEDFFNIDISYYTVVNTQEFDTMFESKDAEITAQGDVDGDITAASSADDKDAATQNDPQDSGKQKVSSKDPYEHDTRFADKNTVEKATTQEAGQQSTTQSSTSSTQAAEDDVKTNVKIKTVREDFLTEASQYSTESQMRKYVKQRCSKVKSNLEESSKIGYADSYVKLTKDSFHYHCVPGYYNNKTYVFDLTNAAKLFRNCNVNEKPVEKQKSSGKTGKSSSVAKVKKLVVLNSTKTSGVAAGWAETEKQGI